MVLFFNPEQEKTMGMLTEFKSFVSKGNVMDLAVGVIIGAAFGKIVASLVEDIVMPVLGMFLTNTDFSQAFWALSPVPEGTLPTLAAHKAAGVTVLAYGNFLTVVLNFLILAAVIFLMVRQLNRFKNEAPAAPEAEAESADTVLLREIRDSLRQNGR
jgi:large conductance mechanosensitive channel